LIRLAACCTPQAAATPIDTMVIASPKLKAATVAAPNGSGPRAKRPHPKAGKRRTVDVTS
jgi:hypothetical protein